MVEVCSCSTVGVAFVSFRDSSYALGVFDILVFCFFI